MEKLYRFNRFAGPIPEKLLTSSPSEEAGLPVVIIDEVFTLITEDHPLRRRKRSSYMGEAILYKSFREILRGTSSMEIDPI
ncbi:MAG: hypothetical protein QXQ57_05845 [Sulfolobales archaeon]